MLILKSFFFRLVGKFIYTLYSNKCLGNPAFIPMTIGKPWIMFSRNRLRGIWVIAASSAMISGIVWGTETWQQNAQPLDLLCFGQQQQFSEHSWARILPNFQKCGVKKIRAMYCSFEAQYNCVEHFDRNRRRQAATTNLLLA